MEGFQPKSSEINMDELLNQFSHTTDLKSILNGRIFIEDQFVNNHILLYTDRIIDILPLDLYLHLKENGIQVEETDAKGLIVSPGFIDVHIHGYKGNDTMDADLLSLRSIAQDLTENGITAFLPTTMTMAMPTIQEALTNIKLLKDEPTTYNPNGAMVLGAHLEGPYINEGFKGAQPLEYIQIPDPAFVEKNKEIIKVITLAPEVDGAADLIRKYKDSIRFSIGHSGAGFEQALEAFQQGACCTTHLFNAMTGLHHRKPGIVGAAFASNCYSELIADTIHVHPGLFPVVLKIKGKDKVLLVTDCMQAGGLDEGEYELGGQKVTVKDGKCTLDSGTIAGSVLKLNKGLNNVHESTQDALETLIPLVTNNQATYLGLENEIGSLTPGKIANIVIFDSGIQIKCTIVKGKKVYENQF